MVNLEMNLPDPPEGYEYTGEFRCPQVGENFLYKSKRKVALFSYEVETYFILKKKRQKVTKEVLVGTSPAGCDTFHFSAGDFQFVNRTGQAYKIYRVSEEWEEDYDGQT